MKKGYVDSGRSKQKLKTRSKILASAQKFLREGQSFGLEDVAKEAGMSRATVYRYYSNVEMLSVEAGLDLKVDSPEEIVADFSGQTLEEVVLAIQDYFNRFTVGSEAIFRKFLSVVIAADAPESKRGARRVHTLQAAFREHEVDLDKAEIEKLIQVATLFMGMEAIVVTKDVCRLDNQASLDVLKWGLEMVLKGALAKD